MTFRPLSTLEHRLAFAVLPRDHFTGTPIPQTLEVTLPGWDVPPVRSPSGGLRQPDGTYRWIDLPDGPYDVHVIDPSGRWRFEEPAATIMVPLAAPAATVIEGWPTPSSPDPLGLTALRARLHDPAQVPLPGLQVSVGPPGGPFLRSTTSDEAGEVLLLVVEPVALDPDGQVTLELEVEGGARPVLSITSGGPATPGPVLSVAPGRTSRVRVEVGP
jgi:hypothetical protein